MLEVKWQKLGHLLESVNGKFIVSSIPNLFLVESSSLRASEYQGQTFHGDHLHLLIFRAPKVGFDVTVGSRERRGETTLQSDVLEVGQGHGNLFKLVRAI